jgi:hypothetical protein
MLEVPVLLRPFDQDGSPIASGGHAPHQVGFLQPIQHAGQGGFVEFGPVRQFGDRDSVLPPKDEHDPSLRRVELLDSVFLQHPSEDPAP